MKKHIYYAHHLYKYDTKVEEYELEVIRKELPNIEILNPNGDIDHKDMSSEQVIMDRCLFEVRRDDVVGIVFSSMSGVVGLGVVQEVNQAKELNKVIYYIKDHKLTRCDNVEFIETGDRKRYHAIVTNI